MKKFIIIGIILVLIAVGVFFFLNNISSPVDTAIFEDDEKEIDNFTNGLSLFDESEPIFYEIDQTFDDILDKNDSLSVGSGLDVASIDQEASEADLIDDLNAFNNDEAIFRELDQAIGEVSF